MPRTLLLLVVLHLCAGVAPPRHAQDSAKQPPPADTEFQRLDTVMTILRNRNAQEYAVAGPDVVDEAKFVHIGGIEQWITIRGEDRKNPVLLLLHGGPGDSTNLWGYAGLRSWLKTFTLVQWDQRGAGRTFGRHGSSLASTMTVEQMARDGIELSELLRKELRTEKIVLVGHSWGSILGVLMAKARPDLFIAFVGTGQVGDPARSYAVAYKELLGKAQRLGDQRAVRELEEVGPPPYRDGRGYAVQRRWANRFEGADMFISSMAGRALMAPGYSLRDLNDWIEGQAFTGEHLVPQTSAMDAKRLRGEFALPVFVIQGAEDFTTPTSLAREFVDSIRAPRKAFAAIEGAGHFAAFMKPDVFIKEVATRVRPLLGR